MKALNSTCRLSGQAQEIFFWESMPSSDHLVPYYSTYDNANCSLTSYKGHSNYNSGKRVILMIGDSLDSHSCEHFNRKSHNSAVKFIRHFVYLANCSYNEHLEVYFWYYRGGVTNEDGNPLDAKTLDYGIPVLKRILDEHKIVPTHVSFGSAAWDTQNAYKSWCKGREAHVPSSIGCLCNQTMRRSDCEHSPFEMIETLQLPWCSSSYHSRWELAYLNHVQLLVSTFSSAVLYLRTQPPGAQIQLGNLYCQNYKNKFVRRLSASGKWRGLKILDYDGVFESVPMLRPDRIHYDLGLREWNDYLVNSVLDN